VPGAKRSYLFGLWLIACGLAACAAHCPAAAADASDPFQIENSHWMSFEHYKDNMKRNLPADGGATAKIEPPDLGAADAAKNDKAPAPVPASTMPAEAASSGESLPAIAAPKRPLDLPGLPGLNKGFDIQVNSTEDNTAVPEQARIIQRKDGTPDLRLEEQNWQDAAEAASRRADQANADSDHEALDVRMTYLPNPKIVPVEPLARKLRTRYAHIPVLPKPEQQQQAAACAAIDSYKKRQLEAIQSDRQTLQALQAAIAELGLQKQLDFMTGGLQTPIQNASSQPPASGTAAPPTP
jgi:hypothetical protein